MDPILRAALTVLGLAVLTSCATNPVTGKRDLVLMSEQQEVQLGAQAAQEVGKEYAQYNLAGLQAYVNQVGQKLAAKSHRPQLQYTFTVVDSAEVNAFALPGGHVYITRGIMAYLNSEAELAGVLGHEIGHVTARHSVRQQSQGTLATLGAVILGSVLESSTGVGGITNQFGTLATAYVRGYGRDNELEADRLGAEYLARAGYDPQAMIRVVGVLKNQELFDAEQAKREGREPHAYHGLFDTHPDADRRLQEVVAAAGQFKTNASDDNRSAFLKATNGMIFGDSPEQGLLRGSTFYHAGLGFAVNFPQDWKVQNRPESVVAIAKAEDVAIEMRMVENAEGDAAGILRQGFKPDQVYQVENLTIGGLAATRMVAAKGGRPFQATAIRLQERLFVFIGLSKNAASFKRAQPAIDQSVATFHVITDAERRAVKPHAIRTMQARPGDSFAQLAKSSPLGPYAEQYLRLINQGYPAGEPQPGETIKVVG